MPDREPTPRSIHPNIHIHHEEEGRTERGILTDLFITLKLMGHDTRSFIDGVEIITPTTPRMDMPSRDEGTDHIAMRVLRSPVMAISASATDQWPSQAYVAMELQCGTRDPEVEDEDLLDEDFDWQPYLYIIVDANDADVTPEIISPVTKQQLTGLDLEQAAEIVSEFRSTAAQYAFDDE